MKMAYAAAMQTIDKGFYYIPMAKPVQQSIIATTASALIATT